jgi:RNA polymerase sigma-70 factor, ECF subfamily
MALARDPTGSTSANAVLDEDCAARVQAGDTSAFGELFQRHNEALCTYLARSMGDDELGRDLAQEAFIKAFQALPSLPGKVYFKSWLYRIAINLAKDHWRHEKLIRWLPWKEQQGVSTPDAMCVEGPEKQVEEAELVRMALARVSPRYRPCLYLDIVEDMKQYEIAAFLDMNERTVRRYIGRGKEELSKAYDRLIHEQVSATKRRSTQ